MTQLLTPVAPAKTAPKQARSHVPLTYDGLSVLIPCFNEEDSVRRTADQLSAVLDETGWNYELIFIDDGSTDQTAAALGELEDVPHVQVLKNPQNRGYGASLKRGLKNARYELLVITDADGTYPNERIPELVELLEDNDMVVGARVGAEVHIPLLRRPAKWFLRKLASYLASIEIPDLNSGLRVMKRSVVRKFLRLLPDGFSFTTTITLAMLTHDHGVRYVAIDYHQRVGQSSIKPIRDTANFISLIVRTVMYFKPLQVFGPVSAALFGLAVIWALVSLFCFGKLADVSVLVIAMASTQMLAIGLLADLFSKRMPQQ